MILLWVDSVTVQYNKGHRVLVGGGHKRSHDWQGYRTCCTKNNGITKNF